MPELYTDNIIIEKTLNSIFKELNIDWNGIPSDGGVSGGGVIIPSPTLIDPIIIGGTFKSSDLGARLEIFPEWDKTIGMIVYDDAGLQAFKIEVGGADIGDVTIGDYDNDAGLLYDKSAGTFTATGLVVQTSSGANLGIKLTLTDLEIYEGFDIVLYHGGDIEFISIVAPGACTAALITTAGNVDAGTHSYEVTYITSTGQTELGTISNIVTADGTHEQVALTAIPISSNAEVIARKIYRTKAGGADDYYLLTTIANNTTTTYTDNTADSSLGVNWRYKSNTTSGRIYMDTKTAFFTGLYDTYLGYRTGESITDGYYNTFIGSGAGRGVTTGIANIYIGWRSGNSLDTGTENTCVGFESGYGAGGGGTAASNTCLGYITGIDLDSGRENVFIGAYAGADVTSGVNNVFVGHTAGFTLTTGDGNIFIGHDAGKDETGSNTLYIENTNSATPLIYGEFDNDFATIYGNLGIGTKVFGTSATRTLALFNGTVPSSSVADTVQLFSTDIGGGDATLGLRTEVAVAAEVDETKFSHKLAVRINGATYYMMLTDS